MASTPADVVQAWSKAIGSKDFEAARKLAHDNLSFRGPIDTFTKADDYIGALRRLSAMVKGAQPEGMIVSGNQVALFYILKTAVADAPVAEWYTIDGGKISAVRAYFDARPFAAAGGPPAH
jgi:limonene-1,2-epoxide hydrolase